MSVRSDNAGMGHKPQYEPSPEAYAALDGIAERVLRSDNLAEWGAVCDTVERLSDTLRECPTRPETTIMILMSIIEAMSIGLADRKRTGTPPVPKGDA